MKGFWLIAATLICLLPFSSHAQFSDRTTLESFPFSISTLDTALKIEGDSSRNGHSYSLNRTSANPSYLELIYVAETLYPVIEDESDPATEEPNNKLNRDRAYKPEVEKSPFWSVSSFDGVKVARNISARSLRYYRDLVLAYQQGDSVPYPMKSTSLKYSAEATKRPSYSFEDLKFENVVVVTMDLAWNQHCGNLCAMGFTIEKVVVFDANKVPIALIMQREVPFWVS